MDDEERREHLRLKGHIAVDERSNLTREAILTGADLHDSQAARALIPGDERAVYADKAYASRALRAELDALGVVDGLMYKAVCNEKLTRWQASSAPAAPS